MSVSSAPLPPVVIALLSTLGLLVTGCSGSYAQPPGPADPYAQPSIAEHSAAIPVATGGEADTLVGGLESTGFFCAQVRANTEARQIWCRIAEEQSTHWGEAEVSTVDIVTTTTGQVGYFRVNLPVSVPTLSEGRTPDSRLEDILRASVFRIWPGDTDDVSAAITDVRDYGFWPGQSGHDPRTPRRATVTTEQADYFVGEGTFFGEGARVSEDPPLSFVAVTDRVGDSWPSSSAHSLNPPVAAAPGLEAGGFDCYGDTKMPCVRGNHAVDYATVRGFDHPVTVSATIGGGYNEDGGFSRLADWGFPDGLTFLTVAVRPAVEARLDRARHDGLSFVGIVSGAVVVIDAAPSPGRRGPTEAVPVRLTVGAPLVTGSFAG